jgi:hypothetical protein
MNDGLVTRFGEGLRVAAAMEGGVGKLKKWFRLRGGRTVVNTGAD